MLRNNKLVKVFFESGRKKDVLAIYLAEQLSEPPESIKPVMERWIRQFNRRWSTSHSESRFNKKHAVWLKSAFRVSNFVRFVKKIIRIIK